MKRKRPRLTDDEYAIVKEYRAIRNQSEDMDVDYRNVKHLWLKDKNASLFISNPEYEQPEFDAEKIDWGYVLKDVHIPRIETPNVLSQQGIFDRLVYTDVHVGMCPNPNGYSQYGGKWDENELEHRMDWMLRVVMGNIRSTTLVIDDLGDFMDGWDGKTVRRQHDLPQNMDNQKAFDVGLRFKINLVANLSQYYDRIIVNNVCSDNHSGAFGYVVNSAFKVAVEQLVGNVEVNNFRKFINHYIIEDNVFIICHGKDEANLKFGFSPHMDRKAQEHIDNYIDEHYLFQPGRRIEFSKGDSHQLLFDWSSSQRFDYFNYMALSPSSSWVQTNYKKGNSGFTFFNYASTNESLIHNKFFEWKK